MIEAKKIKLREALGLIKKQPTFKPSELAGISDLKFQKSLVRKALKKDKVVIEAATGSGKTVIAGRIASNFLKKGKAVLVLCPSRIALGDTQRGIVCNFMRTVHKFSKKDYTYSEVNELSLAYDIIFATHYGLYAMHKKHPKALCKVFDNVGLVVVDEAHRSPEDEQGDLKMINLAHDYCSRALKKGVSVVGLTATFSRLDGKPILGEQDTDFKFSLQDSINERMCPQIYAIEVLMDIRPKTVSAQGEFYDIHLVDKERKRYHQEVAENMCEVWKAFPKLGVAAFARNQNDAEEIAKRFNKITKLGKKGIHVLISSTPSTERAQIVESISTGTALGYITVAVGEESLDIPRIGVVHLIRRTKSFVRNAQAVGRGCRLHKNKNKVIVVDYQMMENVGTAMPRWLGITMPELAKELGTKKDAAKLKNGEALFSSKHVRKARLEGSTMDELRELIVLSERAKAPQIMAIKEKVRKCVELLEANRNLRVVNPGLYQWRESVRSGKSCLYGVTTPDLFWLSGKALKKHLRDRKSKRVDVHYPL